MTTTSPVYPTRRRRPQPAGEPHRAGRPVPRAGPGGRRGHQRGVVRPRGPGARALAPDLGRLPRHGGGRRASVARDAPGCASPPGRSCGSVSRCSALRLAVDQLVSVGLPALGALVVTIPVTLAGTMWLGRRLGLSRDLSLLVASGSAICGASAIAAMDAATDSEEEDVTVAIATVTLFGTAALVLLPLLDSALGLGPGAFGTCVGASVHEVAQVVAAATPGGTQAVETATVVKLTRVLMLAPLSSASPSGAVAATPRRSSRGPGAAAPSPSSSSASWPAWRSPARASCPRPSSPGPSASTSRCSPPHWSASASGSAPVTSSPSAGARWRSASVPGSPPRPRRLPPSSSSSTDRRVAEPTVTMAAAARAGRRRAARPRHGPPTSGRALSSALGPSPASCGAGCAGAVVGRCITRRPARPGRGRRPHEDARDAEGLAAKSATTASPSARVLQRDAEHQERARIVVALGLGTTQTLVLATPDPRALAGRALLRHPARARAAHHRHAGASSWARSSTAARRRLWPA